MKSETPPHAPSTARAGIVDAVGTGLAEAARRPYLWLVPIVVDLVLWLAPRLSITALTEQLMAAWRALLPMVYTPEQMVAQQQGIDFVQTFMVEAAKSVNLGSVLTAGWLAPPSALAQAQAGRYLLISDAVLGPALFGIDVKPLAPAAWQTASIEIGSALGAVAVVALLWIISHLLTALYFRIVATGLQNQPIAPHGAGIVARQPAHEAGGSIFHGWLPLAGRFMIVSLFASLAAFLLRLPLALITLLAMFAGSGATSFLFVIGGGVTLWLTLWFLSSLFFVGDALAFDRQPLWPSLMASLFLVRTNSFRALVLAAIVNVLMLGARAIWGFLGASPAAALLAISVNGYLATAMTIGIFVYYQGLRRKWQAAQLERQLSK